MEFIPEKLKNSLVQSISNKKNNTQVETKICRLDEISEKVSVLLKNGSLPTVFDSPLGVQVEITNTCNLKCIHCYNNSTPDTGSDLPPSLWIKLAKEIRTMGIIECVVSGGEPLLKKDLVFEFMDIVNEIDTRFLFISNGWFVDNKIVETLSKYLLSYVQISLDSPHSHAHDKIRGKKGSWERAIKSIQLLKEAHIPVRVACTIPPSMIDSVEEFIDLCCFLRVDCIIIGFPIQTGRAALDKQRFIPNPNEKDRFNDIISSKRYEYDGVIKILTSKSPAMQLREMAIVPNRIALIRPNGDVKLDCLTPFVFGNIKTDSLQEIWDHKLSSGWVEPDVIEFINAIGADEKLSSNEIATPHLDRSIIL